LRAFVIIECTRRHRLHQSCSTAFGTAMSLLGVRQSTLNNSYKANMKIKC